VGAPPTTDPDLLGRLRRGDERAFDAVYAAHKDALYRFLARMCGRRDLAEDLFQETWVRLARHAARLRDDTDLRAWLYAVARNLCRSHARWAVLDARAVEALGRWWYLDARPPPDDQAASSAAVARLAAAFGMLPARHREVLALVAGEGLGQDDAARILGITHEAARQRLARARAALARRLEPEDLPWKTTLSSKA
jgi:RNA polymerase sigma-70 factor (ECF subfamily)